MEMTIARAMKHRARVASRMSQISRDIQSQNSHFAENKPEVNVRDLMDARNILMNHLIDLRVAIDKASGPIKKHLFGLAERKSQMAFLQQIDTKDGKQSGSEWSRETNLITYTANYRKSEIDEMTVTLETDIDALQEHLDQHNAVTKIVIEVPEIFKHPHRK